jgi:Xaa-Pro aminopeptidase
VGQEEFRAKERRLRRLMDERGFPHLLLASQANFSWLTGGRGHILLASEEACAGLLLTPGEVLLLTNNIELRRLQEEELPGLPVSARQVGWDERRTLLSMVQDICGVAAPASDLDPVVAATIAPLRWTLCAEEQARYRESCRLAALALEEVCQAVRPGQSEFRIAGLVSATTYERGLDPVLILVASDERVHTRRHALPTEERVERYAMLVLCARRHGLIAAATRLVHVGPPDAELRRRHRAVATIDAAMIAGTRPGTLVRDIFARAVRAYADAGFPDEWRRHHQGGLTGYRGREYFATAESVESVAAGQAFAWNPSVAGAKSEDTVLVGPNGPEVLTSTGNFPTIEVEVGGTGLRRPDILVL